MGIKLDCQIVGTFQEGNTFFARVNVEGHEIQVPVNAEQFHKLPLIEATLTIEPHKVLVLEQSV